MIWENLGLNNWLSFFLLWNHRLQKISYWLQRRKRCMSLWWVTETAS